MSAATATATTPANLLAALPERITASNYALVRSLLSLEGQLPADPEAEVHVPARKCRGCDGRGRVPSTFRGYGFGPCAACHGSGEKAARDVSALVRIRELAKDARTQAARAEYTQAKQAGWFALAPEAREAIEAYLKRTSTEMATSFYSQLRERGSLSVRQVEIVQGWIERDAKRAAERAAAVANAAQLKGGRQVLEGVVLSTKDTFGGFGAQTKMLVQLDDGNRLYGTLPAQLPVAEVPGARVRFTAKVEPKERGFGFFSRPTCAAIVTPAPEAAPKAEG